MKTATYKKSLETNQKVLYIGSMFGTIVTNPQKITVTDKFKESSYQIEVVSSGRFLNYRIIEDGKPLTLWDSLHDSDQVREMFRRNSFI